MPDPLMTETMRGKLPSIGATISTDGGSHTAQQPVPPEWQQPPGQLWGVSGPLEGRSEAGRPLVRL